MLQDDFPYAVDPLGGQQAGRITTVRVAIEIGGQIREVRLQLAVRVEGGTSVIQVGHPWKGQEDLWIISTRSRLVPRQRGEPGNEAIPPIKNL